MKKCAWVLFVSLVGIIPVYGVELKDAGYSLQSYAQYASPTSSGQMTMDDAGNLYVAHYDDGKIMKIDSSGQSAAFASGLGNLNDITWGGGTAYGNYLYASSRSPDFTNDKILRIDLTGNATAFASMTIPAHAVTFVGIDRTGNYGGSMFSSGSAQDRLYSISLSGNVTLYADWPGYVNGGGPYGIAFDTNGKYNNKMYLTTIFLEPQNANVSGLFMMNPNGTVSRFAADLVAAGTVDFDPAGTYFDNDMFVTGRTNVNDPLSLWRVFADGSCEEFMTGVSAFTFGDDGAMYVSQYNWGTSVVTISRVIPEPATLLLLAAGGLVLRKRKA